MINVLAFVIHYAIQIYILLIIVRSVISWVTATYPSRIQSHPLYLLLRKLTDPVFRLVHKHVPFTVVGNIDISPILIVLALILIDRLFAELLYNIAVSNPKPVPLQPESYPN